MFKHRDVFASDMTSEERRRKAAADRVAKLRAQRYSTMFEAKRMSHDQEASLHESAGIYGELEERRRGHTGTPGDLMTRLVASAIKRDPNSFFVYMEPSHPLRNEPLPGLLHSLHSLEAYRAQQDHRRSVYSAFDEGLAEAREFHHLFRVYASDEDAGPLPGEWDEMLGSAVRRHTAVCTGIRLPSAGAPTAEIEQMRGLVAQGVLPRDAAFAVELFAQCLKSQYLHSRQAVELTGKNHRLYAAFTQLAHMSHRFDSGDEFAAYLEGAVSERLDESFSTFAMLAKPVRSIDIGLMRMLPIWFDELRDIEELHRVPENQRLAFQMGRLYSKKLPQLKRYLIHRIFQQNAGSAPAAYEETTRADDADLASLLDSMKLAQSRLRRPRRQRKPAVKPPARRTSRPKAAQGRTRPRARKAAPRQTKQTKKTKKIKKTAPRNVRRH